MGSIPVFNNPRAYFPRAWNITVSPQGSAPIVISSDQSNDPLLVIFSVETYMLMEYWQAEVSIYNLNSGTQSSLTNNVPTGGQLISQLSQIPAGVQIGTPISISAGYRNAQSGTFDKDANLIYQGNIFQPIVTRENVVDARLTLRCLVGLLQNTFNFASLALGPGLSSQDSVNQICSSAKTPIPIEKIDDKAAAALAAQKFPLGQIFHGRPVPMLQQICDDNNLLSWISPKGLNIRSMDVDQNAQPDYIYGPPLQANTQSSTTAPQTSISRTLLGVPEQTQDGIVFRVLMDARPKIGDIVQLAPGTAINQLPVQIPGLPPAPNQSLTYIVSGLKRVGNTRGEGDDWYTQITGVTMNFFPTFLLARNPAAS